jgi:NAD(P)-dependent dehydrogenase (short-subunit alcohol dehydrogenase family)
MSDDLEHGADRLDERVFRLDDRVAVVSGGGRGIGAAICRLFARVGARVACVDLDGSPAHEVAASIGADGGRAIAIACDARSEPQTLAAVRRVTEELGPPTVLVNSVAAGDRSGTLLEIDLAEWEMVQRANLTGAYLMSRAVLPHMIAARKGSIIHVASMLAHLGMRGRASYATTKAALAQLTRVMAVDHAEHGIRVNTLSPGPVQTRRAGMRQVGMSELDRQAAAERLLMKRMGRPEEMATAALFLASDAASFVTGSELLADGGETIYYR